MTDDNALLISLNRYKSLLEAVDGIVWEADADTFELSFVSDSSTRILGYTPEEWLASPTFWIDHVYEADKEIAMSFSISEIALCRNHTLEYRMIKANGDIVWIRDVVSIATEGDRPRWLRGIMVDITETKLLADLDHLEKEVLELNAGKDTDVETVLNFYVLGIEHLFPRMRCSVLRVTDSKLNNWASPSLPEAYTTPIREKNIGPYQGSCGAAAYLKEMVIANDIETDERWAEHKQYALAHNLRASWSYPIVNSQGTVIATFGVYYHKVTDPNPAHIAIIKRSARILQIILENRLYAEMMQEANTLLSQGQALANFGTWQWDVAQDKVTWSDALYDIYNIDDRTFIMNFERYMERLHPEDRERVGQIIQQAKVSGTDTMFEERILSPTGNVKYLRSWARVIKNDAGDTTKMIGACLDITQVKTTQLKMEQIAWLQSHVIRAPLARLMGLVDVLQNDLGQDTSHQYMLYNIIDTAKELDRVIHDITDTTKL